MGSIPALLPSEWFHQWAFLRGHCLCLSNKLGYRTGCSTSGLSQTSTRSYHTGQQVIPTARILASPYLPSTGSAHSSQAWGSINISQLTLCVCIICSRTLTHSSQSSPGWWSTSRGPAFQELALCVRMALSFGMDTAALGISYDLLHLPPLPLWVSWV